MDTTPVVNWQSPEKTPEVKTDEVKEFWVAVRFQKKDGWGDAVFSAQYVNKPLEYADDDPDCENEPVNDFFVTCDGEPMESVGWFSVKSHSEFEDYYQPIFFNKEYILLGWAEYIKPEFSQIN